MELILNAIRFIICHIYLLRIHKIHILASSLAALGVPSDHLSDVEVVVSNRDLRRFVSVGSDVTGF